MFREKVSFIANNVTLVVLKLGVLGVLFFSVSAMASYWKMKSDVTDAPPSQGGWSYIYTIYIQEWDTSDPAPNPLYGCSGSRCALLINVFPWGLHFPTKIVQEIKESWVTESKTLGELALAATQRGWVGPNAKKFEVRGGELYCGYLGYRTQSFENHLPGGPLRGSPSGNMYITCNPAEFVPTLCNIREPQVEIRHGLIASDKVNGSRASTQITVRCSETLPVRIIAEDVNATDFIRLSPISNFRSNVTINNEPFSKGAIINAGPAGTPVTLTSQLAGYSGETGNFQGSATILVSIP